MRKRCARPAGANAVVCMLTNKQMRDRNAMLDARCVERPQRGAKRPETAWVDAGRGGWSAMRDIPGRGEAESIANAKDISEPRSSRMRVFQKETDIVRLRSV
jgi:hypothetical protein